MRVIGPLRRTGMVSTSHDVYQQPRRAVIRVAARETDGDRERIARSEREVAIGPGKAQRTFLHQKNLLFRAAMLR